MATAASEPGAVAYLGLGTNLGERERNLRDALDRLARVVTIDAVSSVYETEPVGFREQPDFWNLTLRAHTTLPPERLVAETQRIERDLGRTPSFRNAPRVIDIDLLLYGDEVVERAGLVVPHPRMMERAFVLAPLTELDPALRHPATGESLAERLRSTTLERVRPLFDGARLLAGPGES